MPRFRDVHLGTARPLLKTGSFFLVLQLTGLVAYSLDNVVIAQIMGSSAVQEYAVPTKLFGLAPTLLSFALAPLWPAYREAMARRGRRLGRPHPAPLDHPGGARSTSPAACSWSWPAR